MTLNNWGDLLTIFRQSVSIKWTISLHRGRPWRGHFSNITLLENSALIASFTASLKDAAGNADHAKRMYLETSASLLFHFSLTFPDCSYPDYNNLLLCAFDASHFWTLRLYTHSPWALHWDNDAHTNFQLFLVSYQFPLQWTDNLRHFSSQETSGKYLVAFPLILIKVISIFRGPLASQTGHHGMTMEIVFWHEKPEANNMAGTQVKIKSPLVNANFLHTQAPPNMRTSKRAIENCNRERDV